MKLIRISSAVTAMCIAIVLPGRALAAQTNIAQVPLLNITGTGTVKPNLMLLFDNSGSMDWAFLPDSVGNDNNQCRSAATMAGGVTTCFAGHPPFMSSDFNKVYYNPATRYQAPIRADGTWFPDMTSAATAGWTSVTADGFNSHKADLYGNNVTNSNLLTGFPDMKWCDPSNSSNCRTNTATYTYPDNTFKTATPYFGHAYYFKIDVGEFCTDSTMTNCKSTAVGAAAPAGYPVPVKVRWCNSVSLSACQAKRIAPYIYPRFSTPIGSVVSFGTIAINASSTTTPLTITSATIPDPTTARTVTNGTVNAPTGTDTPLKQQTVASSLAASIIATTGLTNQYWACVRTPVGTTTVSPCSTYGIALTSDNVVAVIPISCSGTKSAANCTVLTDNSRAGWGITVSSPVVTVTPAVARVSPTALISVSGTTANSGSPSLANVVWNGATLASSISLSKNSNAATVASKIVAAIGTGGTVRAYIGGNSITPACAAKSNTWVCLVHTTASSNLDTPSTGAVTNGGTVSFSYVAGAGYSPAVSAVNDTIPTTTGAIAAGSAAPSTFTRADIVPTTPTYPQGANRSDCVSSPGVCTYNEEMTNFANWYAYYKTRVQMAKSSIGLAFAPLGPNYRVGLAKLSSAAVGGAIDLVPTDFTPAVKANWYSIFYATTTSGSTPMRPALDNVGRMFANLSPYNYAAGQEVVQYPCQQNFMLLTTDGYWNGPSTSNVVNNDNTESASRFCTAGRGCVDERAQSQPSLADVSLYWYNGGSNTGTVSLRPSIDDMTKPGLVPAAAGENTHLHINTFTMGLGIDGIMTYEPNYDSAPVVGGDFYKLITKAGSGCPWNSNGAYVWPDPDVTNGNSTVQQRVDDLWHSAINGHGKYFSASDPQAVQAGLTEAIANISIRVGAASAAATSTPNISQQDNDIFSDLFTTVKWYGELSDKKIDITTGIVGSGATWSTTDTLGLKVGAASDTRNIKMLDTATNSLKNFSYGALSATEKLWFDNKCSSLPQCSLLSASNAAVVNNGVNVVNWLRGQQQYADDSVFRAYSQTTPTSGSAVPIVLGDIASSKPAFMKAPIKSFVTPGYSAYKAANSARAPTVFTAANDGMLHAFNARSGDELWAYVPRITMQKLYQQASTNYGINHQFTTDGSPELGDVQIGGVWKTVLVAGFNAGGRGFYALDVTNPSSPVALWEFCADPAICTRNDPDLGLTFGNPQFGMWQGKWVVYLTSGYNNVSGVDGVNYGTSGQGYLYIVDISNGSVLAKVSTGAGSPTTPSGLAKITSISSNPFTDPVTTYIYGGDNQGQMWRFDLTSATPGAVSVVKMGDAGALQPITTRPEVTQCLETDVVAGVSSSHAQRVVLFGTGRLLALPDTATNDVQSLYLLKDKGSTTTVRGSTMVQQSLSQVGSGANLNTYTITNKGVDLSVKDGWYMDWNINSGERMNLDPQVVGGGANVVTTIPTSSSSCAVGGSSNVYQLNVCTGSYVTSNAVAGSTLSSASAAVGFIIVRLPAGAIKMITTTASGSTITTSVTPPSSMPARKVGWRSVNGE